jgi:hypothetical protein
MYICVKMINDLSQMPDGTGFRPEFPAVKGLELKWTDESNHSSPIFIKKEGAAAPVFYGTCDDDADTDIAGVVSVLTEQAYKDALRAEKYKVPHRETWIFNEENLCWVPPKPHPKDGSDYEWNEEHQAWVIAS